MALPNDYIADALAAIDSQPRRPRQSILRRAVSTAYYALFLKLSEDAGRAMAPSTPAALQLEVRRRLQHHLMSQACKHWKQPTPPWAHLLGGAIPAQLITLAGDFVALQQARHEADYDAAMRLSKAGARTHVLRARDAISAWRTLKRAHADAANVFLVSLMHPRPRD